MFHVCIYLQHLCDDCRDLKIAVFKDSQVSRIHIFFCVYDISRSADALKNFQEELTK